MESDRRSYESGVYSVLAEVAETWEVGGVFNTGGVLHGVDLPVSSGEALGISTVSEGEGWGGDVAPSDPGALIVSGQGTGLGDQDLDGRCGERGEDAGNGTRGGGAAHGSLLWAGDLSKFLPLVGAGRQDLGAVEDSGI